MASWRLSARCSVVAFMFVKPARRRSVMTAFLSAARTCGPEPFRTRQKVLAHRAGYPNDVVRPNVRAEP